MINAFMAKNALHAVFIIERDGMTSITAKGFCKIENEAKLAIYQVSDWAFDGREKYGDTPVCGACAQSVTAKKNPPR